ncbi:MAG: rhodanese-like domain-containing protein [Rhizobiaceae bacterium]
MNSASNKPLSLIIKAFVILFSISIVNFANAADFMSVTEASKLSKSGVVYLVDIRHPDEWKQTGVPESAAPISMHVGGFLQKLAKLTGGKKDAKIALICAHGNRSTYISDELEKRGFTGIINVGEGMLGSKQGPGWLAAKLPVKKAP